MLPREVYTHKDPSACLPEQELNKVDNSGHVNMEKGEYIETQLHTMKYRHFGNDDNRSKKFSPWESATIVYLV